LISLAKDKNEVPTLRSIVRDVVAMIIRRTSRRGKNIATGFNREIPVRNEMSHYGMVDVLGVGRARARVRGGGRWRSESTMVRTV
jgi:hypothetical protein